MRIVFVGWSIENGGAERALSLYANAMAQSGEDVHLVCLRDTKDEYWIDERVKRHVLDLDKKPLIRGFKYWQRVLLIVAQMRRIARGAQACVIVPVCIRGSYYYTALLLSTLFSKTRILYTVRNNIEKKDGGRKDYVKYARHADAIWVQLEGQKALFPERMRTKAFAVRNILDERFLEIRRTPRDRISRLINVGRLVAQKNQFMLIEAFAGMIARTGNRDATLTIYGRTQDTEPQMADELKDLIRRHGLQDRVFLPGRVMDIEAKYGEADAFVLSSDYEGCPNALMEAMAAGLPCISTDCPTGPSEIIEDGKTGLLVPVGDVGAMSRAMERMIEDPQWANQLGAAGKERMRGWGGAKEQTQQLLSNLKRICS